MHDTRKTYYHSYSEKTENNTKPRFKPGDTVLLPYNGELIPQSPTSVMWDKEFGGWLLFCPMIGIHEQNYVLESQHDLWIPHENRLWSWWTKR